MSSRNVECTSIDKWTNQPEFKDISDEDVERLIAENPSGMPLEAIGEALGVTRTRVHQILKKAIEKCLKQARARGLTANDCPQTTSMWDRLG